MLKNILKKMKLNESTISMVLGAVAILVIGGLIFNYLRDINNSLTIPPLETERESSTETEGDGNLSRDGREYIVKDGDSLWSIAVEKLGAGEYWTAIAEENNLSNPGDIKKGQILKIPVIEDVAGVDKQEDLASGDEPVVDDVLDKLSKGGVNVDTEELKEVLDVQVSEDLSGGNEATAESAVEVDTIDGDTYTVIRGDNLWNIAVRAYGDGFKWVDIAKANDLANPSIIHRGNVLVIPRSS